MLVLPGSAWADGVPNALRTFVPSAMLTGTWTATSGLGADLQSPGCQSEDHAWTRPDGFAVGLRWSSCPDARLISLVKALALFRRGRQGHCRPGRTRQRGRRGHAARPARSPDGNRRRSRTPCPPRPATGARLSRNVPSGSMAANSSSPSSTPITNPGCRTWLRCAVRFPCGVRFGVRRGNYCKIQLQNVATASRLRHSAHICRAGQTHGLHQH
jgi:hypothetical protein